MISDLVIDNYLPKYPIQRARVNAWSSIRKRENFLFFLGCFYC